MRRQAVRTIAVVLAVLVGTALPAQAGTITFADVVRTIGASSELRPASEVRLRFGVQNGVAAPQSSTTQTAATSSSQQQQPANGAQQTGTTPATTPASPDPTLSQSGGRVETVDLGDVTGTVCDCGEIPPAAVPKGGFPWWALAGIPLICVSGICTSDTPTPPTTPTPPETPVPEPMTLLLFGSGLLALGAGARRRHGRKTIEEQTLTATTEEV
jgi:hypothetical protein